MDCTPIDKEMPILLLTLNFIGVIKYWQTMAKYTKEEFVRRARLKHGDKYNYDKVVYIDSQTDVEIICPFHGSFWQKPSQHLRGNGCPMCNPYHKMSTEEFVKRAREIHGDKYDYSLVEYVNAQTKVKIICPIHGIFEQKPSMHLQGQGCSRCFADRTSKRLRKTKEQFLQEMYELYGDQYDFTNSVYNGTHEQMTVVCKDHGEFVRTPHELLDGKGCHVCMPNMMLNTQTFIQKARMVHGDRYSYDKVKYVDIHTKVCITCDKHGDFWQEPNYHINCGNGCPFCGHEECGRKLSEQKRYTQKQFEEQSIKVHGHRYDYSQSRYIDSKHDVYVICPDHGGFWQNAGEHMCGAGCPMCNRRNGEERVARYLKENNINFIEQHRIANDNLLSVNKVFVVDFFLPYHNAIIEYNGKQHYTPIDYFGGKENFELQQSRDESLRFYCQEHEIKLIEIPYTDFNNIEKILDKELKKQKRR